MRPTNGSGTAASGWRSKRPWRRPKRSDREGATAMRERWRIAILALCAAVAVCAVATFFGNGLGYLGIPRVGLWGMQQIPGKPFTFVVTSLDLEGAAVRAGIRPGDVIDVRMQPEIVRFWLVSEPIAHRPVQ